MNKWNTVYGHYHWKSMQAFRRYFLKVKLYGVLITGIALTMIFFLGMSVQENVAFTDHTKEQKLDQILEEVGMSESIQKLKDGSRTVLSREFGGIDLSGGQWQRLAIARGSYKTANILVLDEPTSAIDPQFEHEIGELFRNMAKGKTTVLITHRLAMAKDADRILVLEHGRITERGNHEALMLRNGTYAYLYEMQKRNYL